jgi:phosphohistidine phosphatase SixA
MAHRDTVIESSAMRRLARFALSALVVLLAVWPIVPPASAADDSTEAWAALAGGGHVALIRHANAPPGYGGDPPGFRLDDCKTQRNLDDRGRAQARALGEAFRSHGVRVDRVVASPVCRCMDTASLMAVGQVESSLALLPDRDPNARVRLRELKEMVSGWRGPGTLVLVSHGFSIQALLGFVPDQAETVVLRPTPGSVTSAHVVGRIAAPRQ